MIVDVKAGSNNKNMIVDVKETAKALGISLGSCVLETRKPPSTKVIKVSLKSEVKIPPTNLAVFNSREAGIGGISNKWNTVITTKNIVTKVPIGTVNNVSKALVTKNIVTKVPIGNENVET